MVLRQVGEGRRLEAEPRQPLLVERVGGALHHDVPAPRVRHARKHPVQRERVGGGVLGGQDDVVDLVVDGADEPHAGARGFQDVLDHAGDRRLAVGARHADEA